MLAKNLICVLLNIRQNKKTNKEKQKNCIKCMGWYIMSALAHKKYSNLHISAVRTKTAIYYFCTYGTAETQKMSNFLIVHLLQCMKCTKRIYLPKIATRI